MAAAAAFVCVGNAPVSAQSVGVEVYEGPAYESYGYYREVAPAPRVYGYYRDDDGVVVEPRVIVRPANCGQYRYWTGTHCADARVSPPDLN
jgi:hypothetical protein